MHHVQASHQQKGENEISKWSGQTDQNALPTRVRREISRVEVAAWQKLGGSLAHQRHTIRYALASPLTRHLDVAADGQQADAVVGVAALESDETLTKADGEDFDPNA